MGVSEMVGLICMTCGRQKDKYVFAGGVFPVCSDCLGKKQNCWRCHVFDRPLKVWKGKLYCLDCFEIISRLFPVQRESIGLFETDEEMAVEIMAWKFILEVDNV